jgi:hypothetical protein
MNCNTSEHAASKTFHGTNLATGLPHESISNNKSSNARVVVEVIRLFCSQSEATCQI